MKSEPLTFWRTVDELEGSPAFNQRLYNEFPSAVEAVTDPVARRTFMKLMGASMALAGLSACTRQPEEKIVPYVRQPEQIIPGKPLFYATAMSVGGCASGLLVESHEGRPTKIEGNPDHPGSVGAADVFAQAAILGLYDPDRARTLSLLGDIKPWSAFIAAMRAVATAQQSLGGAGIRILTETVNSPTLAAQIQDLLTLFPRAKWHQWDPSAPGNTREGAKLAFGEYVDTIYRIDAADVVVSLDADLFGCGQGTLRYARDFARRRKPEQGERMNRFYAFESMPTMTGARADHRVPCRPDVVLSVARALAARVGIGGGSTDVRLPGNLPRVVDGIAKDLASHRGAGLVIAGESQPPLVHALAHLMNGALGNTDRTLVHIDPIVSRPVDPVASLRELVADLNAGSVDMLLIIGGNPVYTAPADLGFRQALDKARLRAHLSQHEDETSERCHWQIPEAHFLEAWSDARGHDGTVSIVQPLIAPLYGGKSAHEVLATMTSTPERSGYDIVRDHWVKAMPGLGKPVDSRPSPEFEAAWRRWLHDGVVPNSALPARKVSIAAAASQRIAADAAAADAQPAAGALAVAFRLDPSVLDGRFANNGWLQELPKPITRIAWDNAVIMSPATAAALKVGAAPSSQGGEHGQIASDEVEIRRGEQSVRGAIFIQPGHADDLITVHLGYGRTRAGQTGNGAGFNAYELRRADRLWFDTGVTVTRTGAQLSLACTQYHHLMEGRNLVRVATRDEFARDPQVFHHEDETPARTITLYPNYPYEGYKWGMAIDVNACIGCNACVVACQAENNIAIVGKDQVLRGREMHWLRVDTYYRGLVENPELYFQPVPCMQCENAPCEVVCPVEATVHSDEGLNDMVYNRCVGTRYCSNNCPYKVRRFNYLLYQDWNTPSLKLGRNPDVSVRSRGVMEKCTYCVQRINEAKINSEKEDRRVTDGEIKTACQQTCPADAIVFGDLNDPKSRVAQLQAETRNYSLLGDLNTRPRTTYLAALRNPNPELEG